MLLGERPPLVVCPEAPEPYIRVIWGAQFVTLSFAQTTQEDRKFLAFAREIRLDLLPDMVVVQPDWLTPSDVAVPPAAEMEALLARLASVHNRQPQDTQRAERVSIPWASLAPVSLVHLMMVPPFLAPATAGHMMHAKADAMGMNQRVAPFLDWFKVKTIEPLQGIAALTNAYLADVTLAQ